MATEMATLVIASEAKQSLQGQAKMDCFVSYKPRNDALEDGASDALA